MAVVQDYYSPEGCHIIVHDDYYRNITPEENQSRLDRAAQMVLQAEFSRYIESLEKEADTSKEETDGQGSGQAHREGRYEEKNGVAYSGSVNDGDDHIGRNAFDGHDGECCGAN